MTPEQIEQIKITISQSIESNVNGKIRTLSSKIDDYIKSDNEWKTKVQPDINSITSMKTFGKVGFGFITVAGLIIGVIAGLRSIFK